MEMEGGSHRKRISLTSHSELQSHHSHAMNYGELILLYAGHNLISLITNLFVLIRCVDENGHRGKSHD